MKKKYNEAKFLIVGSSGGHLTHMYMLKDIWSKHDRAWVTFDKADANKDILEKINEYLALEKPTRALLVNLIDKILISEDKTIEIHYKFKLY